MSASEAQRQQLAVFANSPDELAKFVAKLRVYSISDQDDAGAWIRREFPNLSYIVRPSPANSGEYYYATWTGVSGDVYYRNGEGADFSTVTNEWLDANIRSKGALPLGPLKQRVVHVGDVLRVDDLAPGVAPGAN